MNDFVPEQWEEIGERIKQEDFSPMNVDVVSHTELTKGLLEEQFDEPIEYAQGPRAHNSVKATREEQQRKIKEAKLAAEQVVLQKSDLEKRLQDAYQRGAEESMLAAVEANNKNLELLEQKVSTLLHDLLDQEKSRLDNLESNALQLSLDVANKIIGHAVEINPEYIVPIIRDALKLSGGAKVRKVRVSPQDLEFIEVLKIPQTIKEYDGSWTFEADETIKAGCVLESGAGQIDFQVDKAWERIQDKVLSMRKIVNK